MSHLFSLSLCRCNSCIAFSWLLGCYGCTASTLMLILGRTCCCCLAAVFPHVHGISSEDILWGNGLAENKCSGHICILQRLQIPYESVCFLLLLYGLYILWANYKGRSPPSLTGFWEGLRGVYWVLWSLFFPPTLIYPLTLCLRVVCCAGADPSPVSKSSCHLKGLVWLQPIWFSLVVRKRLIPSVCLIELCISLTTTDQFDFIEFAWIWGQMDWRGNSFKEHNSFFLLDSAVGLAHMFRHARFI